MRNRLTRHPSRGDVATRVAIRDADLGVEAPAIKAPTLRLAGDQDRSTPPELVRGTIPHAPFETIADAGHMPRVEHPPALANAIADHLADAEFR